MKGLDTNLLLRYFLRDDPKQIIFAKALMEQGLSEEVPGYVNIVVLCELVWVMEISRRQPREVIAIVLQTMLEMESLLIERAELVALALNDYRKGADFADALIGWVNRSAGCETTFTFDQKAARFGGFTLVK